MLLKRLLPFFVTANFLFACGGTIGSIKRYEFDVPKFKLEEAVNNVLENNPYMNPSDYQVNSSPNTPTSDTTVKYQDYKCVLQEGSEKYVFIFDFVGDSTYWKENPNLSKLALTHVGKYGKVLKYRETISSKEKTFYTNLFEQKFLNKVRHQLQELFITLVAGRFFI